MSEAVRAKVLLAGQDLGYRPNALARGTRNPAGATLVRAPGAGKRADTQVALGVEAEAFEEPFLEPGKGAGFHRTARVPYPHPFLG